MVFLEGVLWPSERLIHDVRQRTAAKTQPVPRPPVHQTVVISDARGPAGAPNERFLGLCFIFEAAAASQPSPVDNRSSLVLSPDHSETFVSG